MSDAEQIFESTEVIYELENVDQNSAKGTLKPIGKISSTKASSTRPPRRFRIPSFKKAKVHDHKQPKEEVENDQQHLTRSEIDEKPWKYIGYQGYTDFIASENDFFILRRFASVSARIALSLQDQVVVLEKELNDFDWKYSRKEEEDVNNGTFREEEEERTEVLEALRLKLLQYSKCDIQGEVGTDNDR